MSKAIKVSDEDWQKLRQMQAGGETFADAVHRLLALKESTYQFITGVQLLPEYRLLRDARPGAMFDQDGILKTPYRKLQDDRPEMGAKEGG